MMTQEMRNGLKTVSTEVQTISEKIKKISKTKKPGKSAIDLLVIELELETCRKKLEHYHIIMARAD